MRSKSKSFCASKLGHNPSDFTVKFMVANVYPERLCQWASWMDHLPGSVSSYLAEQFPEIEHLITHFEVALDRICPSARVYSPFECKIFNQLAPSFHLHAFHTQILSFSFLFVFNLLFVDTCCAKRVICSLISTTILSFLVLYC